MKKMKQGDVWLADALFKGTRIRSNPVVIVENDLTSDVGCMSLLNWLPAKSLEINMMLL